MASSESSQKSTASQEANLPPPQKPLESSPESADALFLSAPSGPERNVHKVYPDQIIGAQFPAAAASPLLEGADLVLAFANGGEIVLDGFLNALRAENPPQLIFEDGTVFALPGHVARAAPVQDGTGLSVASGPGGQAPESDPGVPVERSVFERDQGYGVDFGDPSEGLQPSGTISPPGFAAAPSGFAAAPSGFSVTDDTAVSQGTRRAPPPPASDLILLEPDPEPSQAEVEAQIQPEVGNRPPSGLSLSGGSVDELIFAGVAVGIASATDPDAGDTLAFSLADNAGGRFAIDAASGLVSTTLPLDFESAASHAITVRATDSAGAAVEESFTISVNDLNEIVGGAGADNLTGTAQTDVIDGQDGDDLISGGDGDDVIFGSIGRDTLNGESGNDSLFGEAENDILDGGPGADVLSGGSGNDALFIDADDTFIDGGTGTDRVDVQGAAGVILNMTSSSIELAFGAAGDDDFNATGSSVSIRQDGAGGNDTLTGGNGGDRLRGGDGADTLFGGGGNDLLDGGAQDDSLTGGAGADVFVFNLSFGAGQFTAEGDDTIADLATADILSFRGVLDRNGDTSIDLADLIGHVSVSSAGGTTTLSFDGGGSIDLDGIAGPYGSLADLTAAGFALEGLA